MAIERISEFLV